MLFRDPPTTDDDPFLVAHYRLEVTESGAALWFIIPRTTYVAESLSPSGCGGVGGHCQALIPEKERHVVTYEDSDSQEQNVDMFTTIRKKTKRIEENKRRNDVSKNEVWYNPSLSTPKKKPTVTFNVSSPQSPEARGKTSGHGRKKYLATDESDGGMAPLSSHTVYSCNAVSNSQSPVSLSEKKRKEPPTNFEDVQEAEMLASPLVAGSRKKKRRKWKEGESAVVAKSDEGIVQPSTLDLIPSSQEAGSSCNAINDGQWIVSPTKKVNTSHFKDGKEKEISSPKKKKKKKKRRQLEELGGDVEDTQLSSFNAVPSSLKSVQCKSSVPSEETPLVEGISDQETVIFSSPGRSKKKKKRRQLEELGGDVEDTQLSSVNAVPSSLKSVNSNDEIIGSESLNKKTTLHVKDIPDKDPGIFINVESYKKSNIKCEGEIVKERMNNECDEGIQWSAVGVRQLSSPAADPNSCNKEKVVEVFKDLLMKEEFPELEYCELLETISENNRPSDDVTKRLSELCIVVNWCIHPTHQVESRVARPPTEEEMKQMECLSGGMKRGRYVLAEDKIIEDNWQKFRQEYGFENPKDFMRVRVGNHYLLPQKEFKTFVRYLGRGLPHRTLHSILNRFRRLFQGCVQGRLPKEWKNVFQKHVERYGKKFSGIKNILQKSSRNLSDSAAYIASPMKAKSFKSLDAKTELFKAILQVTNSESYEDLKGKIIEWNKVSEILNVRSESCRKYWTRYLSGFLAFEAPTSRRAVSAKLIECLKGMNASCSAEVDWNKTSAQVFNLPATFLWHAFSKECEKFNIKYTGDKWKEAIETLTTVQKGVTPRVGNEPMYECCRFVNSKIVYIE